MICENCHGSRYENGGPLPIPCRSCGGSGIMNCCEGPAGNAADIGNNPHEHGGKPGGLINNPREIGMRRAKALGVWTEPLPQKPEPLPEFDECEACEDFDECLGIGVCVDDPPPDAPLRAGWAKKARDIGKRFPEPWNP